MTTNFKLKTPGKKESAIFIQFKRNNQYFKFYPGKNVDTGNWSQSKGECRPSHKHATEINAYLKDWKSELERAVEEVESKRLMLTRERIQEILDFKFQAVTRPKAATPPEDFVSFINSYIESKSGVSRGTISILKQCRKFIICCFNLASKKDLEAYSKLCPRHKSEVDLAPNKRLEFESVDLAFMQKFERYMTTSTFIKKGRSEFYSKNYIGKQIKTLKNFIDIAIDKNLIRSFERRSIKACRTDVDTVYTNLEELYAMLQLELEGTEKVVRDKYVLNCFLGLRYSDLNNIQPENIVKDTGKYFYKGMNQKTRKRIYFKLHQIAVNIMEEYEFRIPGLSANEFNKILKVVSFKAGLRDYELINEIRGDNRLIEKKVPKYLLMTSHAGRRSFCTNMVVSGVPIQSIMSVSGHKSEQEFLKYINRKAVVDPYQVGEQIDSISFPKGMLRTAS